MNDKNIIKLVWMGERGVSIKIDGDANRYSTLRSCLSDIVLCLRDTILILKKHVLIKKDGAAIQRKQKLREDGVTLLNTARVNSC